MPISVLTDTSIIEIVESVRWKFFTIFIKNEGILKELPTVYCSFWFNGITGRLIFFKMSKAMRLQSKQWWETREHAIWVLFYLRFTCLWRNLIGSTFTWHAKLYLNYVLWLFLTVQVTYYLGEFFEVFLRFDSWLITHNH